ncbi:MAG: hypothetical protein ACHP7H_00815 [Hyphomicrobiales bacterium]
MPKNNQQLIASYQNESDETVVALSPQSTGMRLSEIPLGGTQVFLPGSRIGFPDPANDPSDGDSYEVLDADGSANGSAPILITPPFGTTIGGGFAAYFIATAFGAIVLTFDSETDDWKVFISALSNILANQGIIGSADGAVNPSNLAAPAGVVLFAARATPQGTGIYSLAFTLTFTLSAPGTVTLTVQEVDALTSLSGGTNLGAFFYETGTAVVVVGAAPVTKATIEETYAAGGVHTMSGNVLLNATVQPQTLPLLGAKPIAVQCLVTSAVNLSAMSLNVSLAERGLV